MNKTLAIILGVIALIIAIPVLIILAVIPLRSGVTPGTGNENMVPSDLEARTIHDRLTIDLVWTPVDQGTATYVLQRSEDDGTTWQDIATLPQGASSYMDSDGLQDNVTYLYRIHASDPDGGFGYSNTASAIATDLPRPPSTS